MIIDKGRVHFVEVALHARVIEIVGEETIRIQKQYLVDDGDEGGLKIRAVQPGTALEKQMFDMLCSDDAEWGDG